MRQRRKDSVKQVRSWAEPSLSGPRTQGEPARARPPERLQLISIGLVARFLINPTPNRGCRLRCR
jgi:hypothetical protein